MICNLGCNPFHSGNDKIYRSARGLLRGFWQFLVARIMEQKVLALTHVNRQPHKLAPGVIKFSHIAMGSAGVYFLRSADRQRVKIGSDSVFDRAGVCHGNNLVYLIIPVIEFCKQDAVRRVVLTLTEKILQPHFLTVKGVKVLFFRGFPDSA